ncbi:Type II secretion system (T2SS), protein F [uncultured archaeon]|nr:Type II secretion system (T2SS), protein F [uncultured archaeon]
MAKLNPMGAYAKFWGGMLLYAGRETDARRYSMYLVLASVAAGAIIAIALPYEGYIRFIGALAGIVAIHVIAYSQLLLASNARAAKVEEVLPDFLSLVSSNIRAGLTPDKALMVSAREEFGPLTVAVINAGKKSITGMPLDQVMVSMKESIRSNVLDKTIQMIVEGLHSGGDMAELLEKTALDIRKFRSVKKEVNSIILNYILFIMAAITGGAPMLYGVSTFLVEIMVMIKGKVGSGSEQVSQLSGQVGIFKGKLMMTPEGVTLFAAAAIVITVFFGCMAVGVMSSGKRMDGVKYFPLLTLIALGLLFGIKAGLSLMLGSIAGSTI